MTGNIGASGNLNISGTTKLNNDVTCMSSLNVSGTTILNGNVNVAGTLTSPIINLTTSSSGNNPLFIKSTNTSANNCIQFQNDINKTVYMGICGSTFGGNYPNNFFIESANGGIILNTQGRGSASTPNLLVRTDGHIETSGYIIVGTNGTLATGLRIGGFD